jgi:hypothetical protein
MSRFTLQGFYPVTSYIIDSAAIEYYGGQIYKF